MGWRGKSIGDGEDLESRWYFVSELLSGGLNQTQEERQWWGGSANRGNKQTIGFMLGECSMYVMIYIQAFFRGVGMMYLFPSCYCRSHYLRPGMISPYQSRGIPLQPEMITPQSTTAPSMQVGTEIPSFSALPPKTTSVLAEVRAKTPKDCLGPLDTTRENFSSCTHHHHASGDYDLISQFDMFAPSGALSDEAQKWHRSGMSPGLSPLFSILCDW